MRMNVHMSNFISISKTSTSPCITPENRIRHIPHRAHSTISTTSPIAGYWRITFSEEWGYSQRLEIV